MFTLISIKTQNTFIILPLQFSKDNYISITIQINMRKLPAQFVKRTNQWKSEPRADNFSQRLCCIKLASAQLTSKFFISTFYVFWDISFLAPHKLINQIFDEIRKVLLLLRRLEVIMRQLLSVTFSYSHFTFPNPKIFIIAHNYFNYSFI